MKVLKVPTIVPDQNNIQGVRLLHDAEYIHAFSHQEMGNKTSVVATSLSIQRQESDRGLRELRNPYFKMHSALHSTQGLQHTAIYVLSPSARVHGEGDQTWPNKSLLVGCQAGMWQW